MHFCTQKCGYQRINSGANNLFRIAIKQGDLIEVVSLKCCEPQGASQRLRLLGLIFGCSFFCFLEKGREKEVKTEDMDSGLSRLAS